MITGGLSCLLGLLVLVGWHTHNVTLVQLAVSLPPMQYNAAFCLLVSGVALLALARRLLWLARICGLVVVSFGLLTLYEYLFETNLGIDVLLFRPWTMVYTSHAGRMAPHAALSFTLIGVTLLLMPRSLRLQHTMLMVGPLGTIVLAVGLGACLGYLTGLETYRWSYYTHLPMHMAVGCIVLGVGLIAVVWPGRTAGDRERTRLFPLLVGVAAFTVTLILWQTLIAQERALIAPSVESVRTDVHNTVVAQMQSRVAVLKRMARRMETDGKPGAERWAEEVVLYLEHYPELHAVAWVDPTLMLRRIVPRESNQPRASPSPLFGEQQRLAMELARDSRETTASRVFDLPQGGVGVQLSVPIFQGTRFDGCIIGIFRLGQLFDTILAGVAHEYSIALFEGEREIYGRNLKRGAYEQIWGQETAFGLNGVTWRIRLWPTRERVAQLRSALPEVVLAVGLLTGLLLAIAVHYASTARQRAMVVERVNRKLHDEISGHERTAAALAGQIQQMEAVRAVSIEVTHELDLTRLLALVVRRAVELLDVAQAGMIYLWDEQSEVLVPQAGHGDVCVGRDRRFRLGEDIVGTVAQDRQGCIVNDDQTSPPAHPDAVPQHTHVAVIAEPLLYGERLVGVIALHTMHSGQIFVPEDRTRLGLLAMQAAVAIENARLYEALETRLARLDTLTHLNQLVSSSLDFHAVLHAIARAATTLIQAPMVSFWMVDANMQALEVQAFSDEDLGADFPVRQVSFEHGEMGWIATHRRALNVSDVFEDGRFVALDWWRAHGLRSFLGVPILLDGMLLAVLALHGQQPFQFGPDEQQLIDNFVAQAAVALRNAELFSAIEKRAKALTTLNAELQEEITERRRAETALWESEERFHAVAQSTHDAIIAADGHGNIIVWNKGAEKIFGYTEAEIMGQSLTLLMPERYREAHRRGLEHLQQTGEPHLIGTVVEFQGERKDGSEFPLDMSLAMWHVGGETFYSAILRDITERKRTEQRLQDQQEALYRSEKLAAMGSLLASVAHELNNPLAVLLVEAELLCEEAGEGALMRRASKITQAAQRCVRIVQSFLALARESPPGRTPVQLNAIVEEAVGLLSYPLRIDNIALEWQLADDLPLLSADPHQLHQVVLNLVTNAHQALRETSAPRQLTLTTRFAAATSHVVFEVTDTGPGISAELQHRIFEPFFTTKPAGTGTGLGLSLCQGIIEAHGGRLTVTSQPGVRTTFRVLLPVQTHAEVTIPVRARATLPSTVHSKAILVVDDEPGIANALAYLLRRTGHRIETAANGRLALQRLQEKTYDLILCDMRMPDLDGPGLYEALQHDFPHMRRRVIFLTGDTLSPETRAFLSETKLPCLNKPFTTAEVRHVVQLALQDV
jgi:two-component system NtrC family sensor kinase